ncbi:hypothetical protein ARMA_0738 [Ardenticatena maritima]|uniref:Uncharacterized protein n=1 Tax=Ardenticatena maritima TaxID=872965 RepID=A0A0M8K5T0_9CHLR|nr:hypothetical protein ARMA_0738 [Ardenticatena maritima]
MQLYANVPKIAYQKSKQKPFRKDDTCLAQQSARGTIS